MRTKKKWARRALGAWAALERLDEMRSERWLPEDTAKLVRDNYIHRCRGLAEVPIDDGGTNHQERYAVLRRLRRELLSAERDALLRLRNTGEISDEAMRSVERDLGLQEARLEN